MKQVVRVDSDRARELEAFCSEIYLYIISNDIKDMFPYLDRLDNAAIGYPVDYDEEEEL